MSESEAKQLATPAYWDARYTTAGAGQRVHEWFRTFDELAPFLATHLFGARPPASAPLLLHLGSGDSSIPADLAARGYTRQLCVDFSAVVVATMAARHGDAGGIAWLQGDVRDMCEIASASVDVAFDKGTLDAMIHGSPWSPPDEVRDSTGRYVREVFRVLKADGVFLYVTYRQPHFVRPLLECEGVDWEMSVEVLGGADSTFGYHGFVLKKARPPEGDHPGAQEKR